MLELSRLKGLVALPLAALICLLAAGPTGAHPHAQAARACSTPKYPGNGYFTSLNVHNVSCATGRKVALAYYHCRVKHGIAGRCTTRVLHYTCHEKRNTIPTEIDARVTCKLGSRVVVHTYQQNT